MIDGAVRNVRISDVTVRFPLCSLSVITLHWVTAARFGLEGVPNLQSSPALWGFAEPPLEPTSGAPSSGHRRSDRGVGMQQEPALTADSDRDVPTAVIARLPELLRVLDAAVRRGDRCAGRDTRPGREDEHVEES